MIVLSLCAMVKTVQFSNWVLMVDWMRSSVSRSIAAVASSRIRILVFLRRARAKHTSCRCPTLNKHNNKHTVLKGRFSEHSGKLLIQHWFTVLLLCDHTWGSLLPLNTPAPALLGGCWQTCGGQNVPELSTPLHHCTSQKGQGSFWGSQRTEQAPVAEERLHV